MTTCNTASLEAKRSITDAPADRIVREAYETGHRDAINQIMRDPNDRAALVGLPDDLLRRMAAFLDGSAALPEWHDAERVKAAESLFLRHGVPILVAHVTASLPTCYTMKNGVHVLARTLFLEQHALPRLYQTVQLIVDAMAPGGLALRDDGIPGKGIATAQRVRLMHAGIRYLIHKGGPATPGPPPSVPAERMEWMFAREPWDTAWGEPINQEDLAFTALTFSFVTLRALDALGLPVSDEQREGYLHTWSVVGHLLGIERDLLVFDLASARDLFEQIEAHQAGHTEEGFYLTNTIKFFLAHVLRVPHGVAERVLYVLVRHLAGDAVADRVGWKTEPGTGAVADLAVGAMEAALGLEALLEDHDKGFSAVARWVGTRLVAGLTAVPPGAARAMLELPAQLAVTGWPPEAS